MVEINERAVSRLASKYDVIPKIEEPRFFFDRFTFDGVQRVGVPAGAGTNPFRNGFKYPIQIRYIMAAMVPSTIKGFSPDIGDEREIQRYGMRIFDHGSYYMNGEYIPFPLWNNLATAASPVITKGVSCWAFDRPFLLASRSNISVRVNLEIATATQRRVSVTFEGYGKISKTPYIFSGEVIITNANGTKVVDIPPDMLKNEGLEPVVITTMTLECGADDASVNPDGDIRLVNVQIQENGYGTNQQWVIGPVAPIAIPRGPASLLGISQGRCIVHEIPQDGWIWEPNEGVNVQVAQLFDPPSRAGEIVTVGMAGYILVT